MRAIGRAALLLLVALPLAGCLEPPSASRPGSGQAGLTAVTVRGRIRPARPWNVSGGRVACEWAPSHRIDVAEETVAIKRRKVHRLHTPWPGLANESRALVRFDVGMPKPATTCDIPFLDLGFVPSSARRVRLRIHDPPFRWSAEAAFDDGDVLLSGVEDDGVYLDGARIEPGGNRSIQVNLTKHCGASCPDDRDRVTFEGEIVVANHGRWPRRNVTYRGDGGG